MISAIGEEGMDYNAAYPTWCTLRIDPAPSRPTRSVMRRELLAAAIRQVTADYYCLGVSLAHF